jgi:hypothetical protein
MATKRYERDLEEPELRRRKGVRMRTRGAAQAEVARVLDVSRQTTSGRARRLAGECGWRSSVAWTDPIVMFRHNRVTILGSVNQDRRADRETRVSVPPAWALPRYERAAMIQRDT